MWGTNSYLITTLIFAGIPLVLFVSYGFHFYKKYVWKIIAFGLFMGIVTPFVEYPALVSHAWAFDPVNSLGIYALQTNIETIICSSLVSWLFMLIVLGTTACTDKRKPILRTALSHIKKGTFAIWR